MKSIITLMFFLLMCVNTAFAEYRSVEEMCPTPDFSSMPSDQVPIETCKYNCCTNHFPTTMRCQELLKKCIANTFANDCMPIVQKCFTDLNESLYSCAMNCI
ncbi:MAG: hypothetical protein HQK49_03480 [Oligoflexia bacterium]|nr:hypothetical protein [Oligoflexia bacterium]